MTMAESQNAVAELVAEIEKNAREVYRVSLAEYRGTRYIDLRLWYAAGSVWKPGKGITIKPDCLPAILDGLRAAGEQFQAGDHEH